MNTSRWMRAALAAWLLLVGLSTANAQQVASELAVARVVKAPDANGRPGAEQLVDAAAVKPGDLLQYTTTFRNTGTLPARRLAATLPIPLGTEFVTVPEAAGQVHASLNGTAFEPVPLMRKVKQPDGQLRAVPVPLAEYRALRWPEHEIAPGQTFTTRARVRVISLPAGEALAAAATPR